MTSNYESLDEFFKNNEIRVNNFLSKAAFSIVPVYPIILMFTKSGFFPQTSILRLTLLTIISISLAIIFYISNKRNPGASYNKYILILFTNLMIFLLSIEQGLQVSIVYILAPICSCLYFNERFTIQTFIFCYLSLLLSYIIRSFIILDEFMMSPSRQVWRLTYTVGSTVEYIIFALVCFFISKEVKNLIINVFNHRQNVRQIQEQIIVGFGNIIEAKEGINARHIKLTTEYLKLICNKLKENGLYTDFLTDSNIKLMTIAVPFHDIGKVIIPPEILNKTEKLTPDEFSLIKYHPVDSADFISKKLSVLHDAELVHIAHDMALYHHERVDGNGYPYKLKGDSIPLSAKIMAGADILDTLLSKRAYKEAYSTEKALQIIKEISGKSLDKNIADALLSCADEINYIQKGGSLNYD